MTENTFNNVVAQIAHVLGAYSVILTVDRKHWHHGLLIASLCIVVVAAVKEFWYDFKYETPEERGSSFEDFCFYMIGLGIALLLVLR